MRSRTLSEHLDRSVGPKRILSLDGGGIRGALSLGYLARLEGRLRERLDAGEGFRLCDFFDLIAGTSTGAIIAAGLAQGMSVEEIQREYRALGDDVFEKSFFRRGVLRAKYDESNLIEMLQRTFGRDVTLGSDRLRTGLLVMTKRLDTGSPWPLTNNPAGKFFDTAEAIPNRDYPLWQVVRASTAAPAFFDPEWIEIARSPEGWSTKGLFVDGGVSPFNNPALQAFMVATLSGHQLRWKCGADALLVVSIGTGRREPSVRPTSATAGHAVGSLVSLMDDCGSLVETMMQWMSRSPTARGIDADVGDLGADLLGGAEQFHYLRYDLELSRRGLEAYLPGEVSDAELQRVSEMDDPRNLPLLERLGAAAAERDMQDADLPDRFL
ncbi:MAG: hypothetical protein EVA89_21975 [Sandaracinaceae bacterium]|nr:MAG: hypothetical protein EVA89_21975 [Sandaracinaceae bacterium]